VYDPKYAKKQQEVALANLDRTEMWLMAQRIYLKPVDNNDELESNATNNPAAAIIKMKEPEKSETQTPQQALETLSQAQNKKTVRFSMVMAVSNIPRSLPSKLRKHESAYYRAFQDYFVRTCRVDAFVHRLPRFEALQAQRVSLRQYHRNQLLGKYQLSVVPQSAKKRLSANVARGDDVVLDDPEKFRREQEHEAMRQMGMATWHVAAVKMLNGGRLISAPVAKRLNCITRMSPGKDGVARDRARILDLGGQATCDWAWHCALQYPNTKIYTVTTKAIRQLSNSNIRGPPNHRQVAVERLTRLPFEDNQFDLVSARELHSILKYVGENGEDEWENCLRECLRVLKPGGYLEFSLLDSDIMNAGPLGLAKSVEFGFALKTLGYDPSPTKLWLGRLARAGFDDVRRAWVCLPIGERRQPNHIGVAPGDRKLLPALPALRSGPNGEAPRTLTMEAMVTGSTDGVASLTGIVGGWSWERWLLRCEMEKVAGELRLADTVTAGTAVAEAGKCLEGVAAIVEEGRTCGAGWRMLNGYARKPLPGTGMIPVKVAMR
jgi:SAM-dependent methyltransferase